MAADGINHGSGPPLYEQVARAVRERIMSGELHGRLPSEVEMAAGFRVSKGTLRKALALLKAEGLVESRQGWANWVVPPGERQS